MTARARSPTSPDTIAAANAAAAASARPALASHATNGPSFTPQSALGGSQSSENDDTWSARSNASVSSYNSSTREMNHHAIANVFFGPLSTATEAIPETDEDSEPFDSRRSIQSTMSDRGQRRRRRRRDTNSKGKGLFRRVFRQRTASETALTTTEAEESDEEPQLNRRQQRRSLREQLSLPLDSPNREDETPEERARRKENRALFEDLVHLANTHQPVQFDAFKKRNNSRVKSDRSSLSAQLRRSGSATVHDVADFSASEEEDSGDEEHVDDDVLNTELLEAYIVYSKSIRHEPNIRLNPSMIPLGAVPNPRESNADHDDDDENDQSYIHRASYIQERPVMREHQHMWTGYLGTRHSKRRGSV